MVRPLPTDPDASLDDGVAPTGVQHAAVGLGSNLEDPCQQVLRALDALDQLPQTCVVSHSALYTSPPWGVAEQPWFVNAAAVIETSLSAEQLHAALARIEDAFGRLRGGPRWGPRILDLDLLLYGDQVINTATLSVPHPRMAGRAFVLVPLAEIAADWRMPGAGTVADACAALDPDQCVLKRIAPAA